MNWELLFSKPHEIFYMHAWPPNHLKQYALSCIHFIHRDTANEETKVTIPIDMTHVYILLSPKLQLLPNSFIYLSMHHFPTIYWVLPTGHAFFFLVPGCSSEHLRSETLSVRLRPPVPCTLVPCTAAAHCSTMEGLSRLGRRSPSIQAKQRSLRRGLSLVTACTLRSKIQKTKKFPLDLEKWGWGVSYLSAFPWRKKKIPTF